MSASPGALPTVLVVDDELPDVIWCTRQLLRSGRFGSVSTASSGAEALKVLASVQPPPTVVFLDIKMPGMDGFAVLDALSDGQNHPPVVMLTSSDDPQEQARARAYPFVIAFVVKPIRIDDAIAVAADLRLEPA